MTHYFSRVEWSGRPLYDRVPMKKLSGSKRLVTPKLDSDMTWFCSLKRSEYQLKFDLVIIVILSFVITIVVVVLGCAGSLTVRPKQSKIVIQNLEN